MTVRRYTRPPPPQWPLDRQSSCIRNGYKLEYFFSFRPKRDENVSREHGGASSQASSWSATQRSHRLECAAPIVATTSAVKLRQRTSISDTASTTFAGTTAVADTPTTVTATAITATTVAATGVAATATVHNPAITMESFMETRSAPNAFDDGHKNDHA